MILPRSVGLLRARLMAVVVAALSAAFGVDVAAQGGTIQGRVTAASTGAPISSAEVSLTATNLGTRTGEDGRFVLLNVPAGPHDLRILAIGYKLGTLRLTVLADSVTTADVQLSPSVLELDAVVVTGTPGAARLRELGNSITRIDFAKDVKDPPANMDQLLQGRVPGVSVMQTGGSAGAGAQIRLRGPVSVTQSNQPIVYVDGIRVRSEGYRRNRPPFPGSSSASFRGANYQASPLNDINPADIDHIEIIKGSAATTLYGTEAAAGVIQIFTKRGSSAKPRWTFETDQGFAQLRPFGTADNPYVNLRPKGDVQGYCPDKPVSGCSWIRNAYRERYLGSVAGGLPTFQYFLSGTWEDNDGVLPLDNETRLATRGNFAFNLLDNLRVEWNSAYSRSRISNTPSGNNAQGLTLNVYRGDQNYRQTSNPVVLDSLLNQDIRTTIDHLVTGGTVAYTPLAWFSNRFTVGYDLAQQENRNLRPFGSQVEPAGKLLDEQIKYTTLTFEYVGNLDYRLSDPVRSTFSFGGQSATTEEIRTTAYGEGFPGPGLPTVTNGAVYLANESRLRVINAGFFLQNVLKVRDRYFLTSGVRFDGNSAFGRSLGLQAYPKLSASYVVSEEPFWPRALGEFKLRGAVGWSGRAPGAFDAVRSWAVASSAAEPGYLPGNPGNPDVGPERTREIELGLDGAVLDNRVSGALTWYHRRTSDALFAVRQVPSVGFLPDQRANVGVMQSAGVELSLSGSVISRPDWGLDLGTSVTTAHSKIVTLGAAVPFAAGGGWVEGGFPAMVATGTWLNNPDAYADPDTTCPAGRKVTSGRCAFGPQQPTLIWGLNATLRLPFPRGATLSTRGEYQSGAWIQDGASLNALERGVRWPLCERAYGVAGYPVDTTKQNLLTARERLECIPTHFVKAEGIMWFPQDFFKLRDVTLTIPLGWAIRRASSATLSITAQNFVRWVNRDLRMFDPEMVGRDALDEQNRDIQEHVPPPAVVTVALRATF